MNLAGTSANRHAPPYALVVEDDANLRAQLIDLLAGAGYRTIGANSVGDALERVSANPPVRVVVSDIHLPDGNAIVFLRRLGDILLPPAMPKTLLITGKPTLETAIQAVGLQVVAYIPKPIHPAVLLATVARAWGLASDHRADTDHHGESDRHGEEAIPERLRPSHVADFEPEFQSLLARLQQEIAKRKQNKRRLHSIEFSDPEWDMLLELMLVHMRQTPLTVTSLCLSARVPATTALRRLENLVKTGFVERHVDPTDRRRVLVRLTAKGVRAMTQYFRRGESAVA